MLLALVLGYFGISKDFPHRSATSDARGLDIQQQDQQTMPIRQSNGAVDDLYFKQNNKYVDDVATKPKSNLHL